MFFIAEQAKETVFEFLTRNCKSVVNAKYSLFFISIKWHNTNSQYNKLKSTIKNGTEVVLRLSSNIIGDNETNFPHKLLLTDRQVSNICKVFSNNSSADIKLSKT